MSIATILALFLKGDPLNIECSGANVQTPSNYLFRLDEISVLCCTIQYVYINCNNNYLY